MIQPASPLELYHSRTGQDIQDLKYNPLLNFRNVLFPILAKNHNSKIYSSFLNKGTKLFCYYRHDLSYLLDHATNKNNFNVYMPCFMTTVMLLLQVYKTARNKSQLFNETIRVKKFLIQM